MNISNEYDVLIVGGGMVGATLACAFGGGSLRVGVIEAFPFGAPGQPSFDDRSVALAYGSRRVFEGLGLWAELRPAAAPIHKIHISNRGHFGFTRINCEDYGVDALGYVVENRAIGAVLSEAIKGFSNVDLLAPVQLRSLDASADGVTVTISRDGNDECLRARLVVGADGNKSAVRESLGIACETRDYDQAAIIANVITREPHKHVAYERFTDQGPLAFLPLTDARCSVVWTVRPDRVDGLLALDDEAFAVMLGENFGTRLGRIERVGRRTAYPLTFMLAKQCIASRVALIGNAAHALHPVAGQGFNLGIRDVAVLAQVVMDAAEQQSDIGDALVLQAYANWRKHDQDQIMFFTDALARVFTNPLGPVVLARNIGLVMTDLLPAFKGFLARRTMGLAGKLPRLARGLAL